MSAIHKTIIKELEVRIIECGIRRVIACIEKLSEDQLNYRPNSNSNSINNQVLHLDGNVRQWLIASFLDKKDNRKRTSEFDPANLKSKDQLLGILRDLENDIRGVFSAVESSNLNEVRQVQCYEESNLSIIIHVIEHFSYHVGQITYITKMLLDIDTGYYAGLDLEKINS